MLIVLSPAKTLDLTTPPITDKCSLPDFISHSAELIEILKAYSPAEISGLMQISNPLAALNVARYASWSNRFTPLNAKQAVLAFNGDVYAGLDAASMNAKQLDYSQSHMRILSGLYGVLRPLDLIQPYRLEMGTRLASARGSNLYAFWGNIVTDALNVPLGEQQSQVLINLASYEYFKAVRPHLLTASVITPVFEDWKSGKHKVISFYAKRARGLMARYAADMNIVSPGDLKSFDYEGYAFDKVASSEKIWVFRRRIEMP